MTLELSSVPLAWLAGVLGIASPCVWPLVPVVMSSAASTGAAGAWMLGLGLSSAFALAGTVLTLALLNLGLDPELFRGFAAVMLVLVAVVLLLPGLLDRVTAGLSRLGSRLSFGSAARNGTSMPVAQFGVGVLLGLVWLPCVGPTLGAAVALASLGQSMTLAFAVMFAFGVGTACALLLAGSVSRTLLLRWRPGIMRQAGRGKKILGSLLLLLGVMVLTGLDRVLEAYTVAFVPEWAYAW